MVCHHFSPTSRLKECVKTLHSKTFQPKHNRRNVLRFSPSSRCVKWPGSEVLNESEACLAHVERLGERIDAPASRAAMSAAPPIRTR